MASDPFGAANRGGAPIGQRQVGDCELEARLDRLLSDPTVQLLMERDGVEREALLGTIRVVRRRIAEANGPREGVEG